MSILCTIKNLNLSFGHKLIFKEASFNISHGDKIGLLGLNGQGKSSLFKVLGEVLTPDISSPPFQFDKASSNLGEDKKYSCLLIPQEMKLEENDKISIKDYIYRFYPELETVQKELENIEQKFESHNLDDKALDKLIMRQTDLLDSLEHLNGNELLRKYLSYLKYFGLNNIDQKVLDLSGGEQKKILLSLGLSTTKNLVLWDEPTNHLDLETIEIFESELKNFNKTFIMISHDRYLLSNITEKIFHIKKGSIESFKGNYTAYLEYLVQEEEIRKSQVKRLSNSLKRETDWMHQGIKARGTRSKKRVEEFLNLKKSVKDLVAGEKKKLELSIKSSGRKTKTLISLKDLSIGYNDNPLIKELTIDLTLGDKIGLMGGNGAGKTTLLKTIMGQTKALKGSVKTADNIKVQYFSQDRNELSPLKSPFEVLGQGTDYVTLPDGRQQHVAGYFGSFLFNRDDLHRPLSSFSGGEKNRLQMAINLLKSADLWIFDEPTNDLDLETLEILEEKLQSFKGTLIIISHDRAFLSNVTNRIWLIKDKSIEHFQSGYAQVSNYLDALIYQNLISKEESEVIEEKKPIPMQKNSAKIQKEIIEMEGMIDILQKRIESINLSNLDSQTSKELGLLSSKKEELEEKLLVLYESEE